MLTAERLIIHKLLAFVILLTFGATVSSYLGGLHWRFEYIAHWRVQLCGLSAALFIAGLMTTLQAPIARRYMVIGGLTVALNLYPIAQFLLEPPPAISRSAQKTPLRVMAVNVNIGNRNYAAVIREIREKDPDIVLIMEVTDSWMRQLAPIETVYPHKVAAPKRHAFGMVLYGKSPFTDASIEEWGPYRLPYILATTRDIDGNAIRILGAHTIPPVGERRVSSNRRQSRHLFGRITDAGLPIVMMGDWNNTPWSHSYRTLLSGSGFQNAAQGNFPSGTWRTGLFGGIMIDHIFVRNLQVGNWHVGQDIGSDHRPVLADLQPVSSSANLTAHRSGLSHTR